MSGKTAGDILRDPDFLLLSRRKKAVTAVLAAVQIALFFGFIGLIAFDARIRTRWRWYRTQSKIQRETCVIDATNWLRCVLALISSAVLPSRSRSFVRSMRNVAGAV